MIVDASVVFKWFSDEDKSDEALALVGRHRLLAPTLLLIEIGNALWKKARCEQIDRSISFEDDLASLATIISLVDESMCVPRALTMARALDHAIYDCVYLSMAESEGQRLVTADRRFLERVRTSVWSDLVEELV